MTAAHPIEVGPFTVADCAYAAGILDGEGSVILSHTERRGKYGEYRVRVSISNTDESLMGWLVATFGGAYTSIDRDESKNWRRQHIWYLTGRYTVPFLTALLPYLKLKRRQAECVLEYVSTCWTKKKPWKHPPEIAELRARLSAEVCALNRRGRKAA